MVPHPYYFFFFFFFNDTATTEIYTLSLHDALPIFVSKWGIGSGISLFIAGGVAQQIFTGTFNFEPANPGSPIPAGASPKTVYYFQNFSASALANGRIEHLLVQPPNPLIALIGTIAIF